MSSVRVRAVIYTNVIDILYIQQKFETEYIILVVTTGCTLKYWFVKIVAVELILQTPLLQNIWTVKQLIYHVHGAYGWITKIARLLVVR